jgi:hypothetical protein
LVLEMAFGLAHVPASYRALLDATGALWACSNGSCGMRTSEQR